MLSPHGKQLQLDISRVISELDDIKYKFKPKDYHLGISVAGTEFGLSTFSHEIIKVLDSKNFQYSTILKTKHSAKDVERAVADGEVHLGIVTRQPSSGFKKIRLGLLVRAIRYLRLLRKMND